jgi:hypothetical protein
MSDMRRTKSIKWIMARTLGGGIVFCLERVLLSVFGWTAKQLGPLTSLELVSWFLTGLCVGFTCAGMVAWKFDD